MSIVTDAAKEALLKGLGGDLSTWAHVTGQVRWSDRFVEELGPPVRVTVRGRRLYLGWDVQRPGELPIDVTLDGSTTVADVAGADPGSIAHIELPIELT